MFLISIKTKKIIIIQKITVTWTKTKTNLNEYVNKPKNGVVVFKSID